MQSVTAPRSWKEKQRQEREALILIVTNHSRRCNDAISNCSSFLEGEAAPGT